MATLEMNVRQVNSDFQAIKDKIVEHGVEVADGTKTAEYASKVDDVFEAGKKAEYDAFWDAFQDNGNRTRYEYAFASGWSAESFNPKYDIKPTSAQYMFNQCKAKVDFREVLAKNNITFDFSNTGNDVSYAFSNCSFTAIPVINLTNLTKGDWSTIAIFGYNSTLHTIEKIIIKEDGSTPIYGWFYSALSLVEVRFEGVIGQNGLNLQWSTKLSKASITSIINALSTTTSGLTVTLSKTAVNNAFEGGSTGSEWTTLIGTKTNWTISLV